MWKQRGWCGMVLLVIGTATTVAAADVRVGVVVKEITPPLGFPIAGYYHERLAEGTLDPLLTKALVFRDGETTAGLLLCDLIAISADLSYRVRDRVAEQTGVPRANWVIAGTHTHTAPQFSRELWLFLGKAPQAPERAAYMQRLVDQMTAALVEAFEQAQPAELLAGRAEPAESVSFNRRFVMRDGSVRTWMNLQNPEVVRAAGPIDPEINLLIVRGSGQSRALLSNFALHLDTVGGMKWSADYPYHLGKLVEAKLGPGSVSLFGTGCCGDINHANPAKRERNTADRIGQILGTAIVDAVDGLQPINSPRVQVRSSVVPLPLQDCTRDEIAAAVETLRRVAAKEKVDFFEHVTAHKRLIVDHLRHAEPFANLEDHADWGLSRAWYGVGATLPAEVTTITLGSDVAIVCLPGEVFVDLGLAIKRGSPYRTTLVIELANCVETIYIPHRAAYAGGSYEVTNSTLAPGAGEMLVEAALRQLRETASNH